MLARNDTRGVRVGFYAKALVRGGQAVQTPCLEHMRVHHCAGCGSTRAKLETLRSVREDFKRAPTDWKCAHSARAARRYLPADAFEPDGKTLRAGWAGTAR